MHIMRWNVLSCNFNHVQNTFMLLFYTNRATHEHDNSLDMNKITRLNISFLITWLLCLNWSQNEIWSKLVYTIILYGSRYHLMIFALWITYCLTLLFAFVLTVHHADQLFKRNGQNFLWRFSLDAYFLL